LMSAENVTEVVSDMWFTVLHDIIDAYIEKGAYKEQWPLEDLAKALRDQAGLDLPLGAWAAEEGVGENELRERVVQAADNLMAQKRQNFVAAVEQKPESFFLPPDMPQTERASVAELLFQDLERSLVLQGLDKVWKEHLLNLDHLRQGINLRAYAQRDPLNEYKAEAFALFGAMLEQYRSSVTKNLMTVDLLGTQMPKGFDMPQNIQLTREDPALMAAMNNDASNVVPLNSNGGDTGYISRNGPCTCGSGKKYKYCHGKL
jgi:preprotein translocase subunit SecA